MPHAVTRFLENFCFSFMQIRQETLPFDLRTQTICCICRSEEGVISMTCSCSHAMCHGCARNAVVFLVSSKTPPKFKYLCGCYGLEDSTALVEVASVVERGNVMREWIQSMHHLLLKTCLCRCQNARCEKVSSWPLQSDIKEKKGKLIWQCECGQVNAFNTQKSIEAANAELSSASTSLCNLDKKNIPLRRACPCCAELGYIILCEHEGGCKRFPEDGRERNKYSSTACTHDFCFHCLHPWTMCGHDVDCVFAPVQQFTLSSDGRLRF